MPATSSSSLAPLQPNRAASLRIPLHGLEGRDRRSYLPDPGLIAALNAAIALGLPLLLTGEPGCGKTDFAHAIANFLDRRRPEHERQGLRECYVRSDTRARDLLYTYDALRRFGDAQHGDDEARHNAQDPRHYVELQPLGLALVAPIRQVVLIDEIDKAPRDLPNDLLRELERGEFEIPEIAASLFDGRISTAFTSWPVQQPIQRHMRPPPESGRRPVIIITSNVERQLPDAFLRRCVFYHIQFPDPARLSEILVKRLHDDRPVRGPERAYIDQVVALFTGLRGVPGLHKKPSTAELLNWVDALDATYEASSVRSWIAALAGDLTGEHSRTYRWRDVPALSCLIKLREDLEALG